MLPGISGRVSRAALLALVVLPYAALAGYIASLPASAPFAIECPPQEAPRGPGRVIVVAQDGSGDYESISEAVEAASPGDTIIVKPGVYVEEVEVAFKPWVTIEGAGPGSVILDGEGRLGNGVSVYCSDHVTIANLTVRNYLENGVEYINSDYFLVRNLVALDNREYGVVSEGGRNGVFYNVTAAGSGDSGLYIGEVYDCNCTIEASTAYNNTLGYSGTRARGVVIKDSWFYNNSVGIAPNTLLPNLRALLTGEWGSPVYAASHVIVNNTIEYNNNRRVKAVGWAEDFGVPIGTGIAMIGTAFSVVEGNVIRGHEKWGIAEWYFLVPPLGNVYAGNMYEGNGADYWRDGWGIFSCTADAGATGDTPPRCDSLLRLALPNPLKLLQLVLSVEAPGEAVRDPEGRGYEPGNRVPGYPLALAAMLAGMAGALSTLPIPGGFKPGLRLRRLASGIVDAAVAGDVYLALVALMMALLFGFTSPRELADAVLSFTLLLFPLAYFTWATVWVFMGIVLQHAMGRTLGERVAGLKPVYMGSKPGTGRIIARNLGRYLDLLALGLPGIASIALTGRSLGDIIAGIRYKLG